MTVHPAFGAQAVCPEMMAKVQAAREWKHANGAAFNIPVDGGITVQTAPVSIVSGANVLVAGTPIFRARDYASAIAEMRSR
jgi:ribulose-phosphate 3-epimerase